MQGRSATRWNGLAHKADRIRSLTGWVPDGMKQPNDFGRFPDFEGFLVLNMSQSILDREHTPISPLNVLIADDHAIFRTGLRLALEAEEQRFSVTEAANFDEMLALAETEQPSVLILDLRMPGLTMPDGVKQLRRRFPGVPLLILSASCDAQDMISSLGAGASGYVTKESDICTLFDAINLVRSGGVFVPSNIVAGQGDAIGAAASAPEREVAVPRLTRRQFQVLSLVLDGHANKEVAYRLEMSEGTVKTHLASVMRMYDVNNRVQLLRQVERVGYRH